MKIDEPLSILSRVTTKDNAIFLNCGLLDGKRYQVVNKIG